MYICPHYYAILNVFFNKNISMPEQLLHLFPVVVFGRKVHASNLTSHVSNPQIDLAPSLRRLFPPHPNGKWSDCAEGGEELEWMNE